MADELRTGRIAVELLGLLGTGRQSARLADLGQAEAYAVAARIGELRAARGERATGRKIAFTNTTLWELYGVRGPTWGFVYDTTARGLRAAGGVFDLTGLPEPRIEPEIVLHLARAPVPGMDERALLACIDWVAHGFEIVQSVYPGWKFGGPEVTAAFGLHGGLLVGPRHDISADRGRWGEMLESFRVTLRRDGAAVHEGHAGNVLGGPVRALRFLVEEIARFPGSAPLAAGEIITTGTLTDAPPVRAGETWSTELEGIPIDGIAVTLLGG